MAIAIDSEDRHLALPLLSAREVVPGIWEHAYVALVMLTLPIDWFAPTGLTMREFGAKPCAILLTIGGVAGLALTRRLRTANRSIEFSCLIWIIAMLAVGTLVALINFIAGWSSWDLSRNPLEQFINQSLLIIVAGVALVGNSRLLRATEMLTLIPRYLRTAAVVHLAIFAVQAAGVLGDTYAPLSLFRVQTAEEAHRATGLFSEPAYFGTFAALYGSVLLALPGARSGKVFNWCIAGVLFACSVAIGAKTFVVVLGAQVAYFVLRRANSWFRRVLALLALLIVSACALFFIQRYSALDVQRNLSSADRLGSTVLAANVALQGYGLTGVGTGQFHFFYRDEFAPDFLRFSKQGALQLSPNAPNRASTYNFYLRVLDEFGIIGFILLVVGLWIIWRARLPEERTYAGLIFAGSMGFLLTQDTYFYPPLVFSVAIIVAIVESKRVDLEQAAARSGLAGV